MLGGFPQCGVGFRGIEETAHQSLSLQALQPYPPHGGRSPTDLLDPLRFLTISAT